VAIKDHVSVSHANAVYLVSGAAVSEQLVLRARSGLVNAVLGQVESDAKVAGYFSDLPCRALTRLMSKTHGNTEHVFCVPIDEAVFLR
jgi:hypothetical protein